MSLVPYALELAGEILRTPLTYAQRGQWLGYGGPTMTAFPPDDLIRGDHDWPTPSFEEASDGVYSPLVDPNLNVWLQPLSDDERRAFRRYTTPGGHWHFNDPKRTEANTPLVAVMRGAFSRAPRAPLPFPVYRGLALPDLKSLEALRSELRDLRAAGRPYTPPGFSSSDLSPAHAWDYGSLDGSELALMMEVMAERGYFIPHYEDPHEFLMDLGTEFEVADEKILPVRIHDRIRQVPMFQLRQLG